MSEGENQDRPADGLRHPDGAAGPAKMDGARRDGALLASVVAWEIFKSASARAAKLVQTPPASAPAPASEQDGRGADRLVESGREIVSRERSGARLIAFSIAAATAAGVGFLFIYWTGGNNLLLGGTLALFLGGIGASLVVGARRLMVERQAVEPREEMPSSARERQAVLDDFRVGANDIHRRGLLIWAGATASVFIGAIVVSLFRSLGKSPDPTLFAPVWKRGQRLATPEGAPVSVNALQPGNTMIVFPENSIGDERAQTVLIRVDPQFLQLPRERSDWAPMGYVAYSRVCTHAGCAVGMYEATTDQLMCPCHQSTFDVLRAAQPTGGPAARALPQLPLYADADGNLRAAGGFSAPPGPGYWELPC